MKALEKDRRRRYGSASDLASDLDRYLRNEPVLASPPSQAYRLKKWVRRNRAASAILATGLAASVITSVMLVRERIARREAVEARAQAEESETTERLAREAAENLIARNYSLYDKLERLGRVDLLADVSVAALDYFDQVPPDSGSRTMRLRYVDALQLRADVLLAEGELDQALACGRDALAEAEKLLDSAKDAPESERRLYAYEFAWANRVIASALSRLGRHRESLLRYQDYNTSLVELQKGQEQVSAAAFLSTANSYETLAMSYAANGDYAHAGENIEKARGMLSRVGDVEYGVESIASEIAQICLLNGEFERAFEQAEIYLARQKRKAASQPDDWKAKLSLAYAHYVHGSAALTVDQRMGIQSLQSYMDISRGLVEHDEANMQYLVVYMNAGLWRAFSGDLTTAEGVADARAIIEELRAKLGSMRDGWKGDGSRTRVLVAIGFLNALDRFVLAPLERSPGPRSSLAAYAKIGLVIRLAGAVFTENDAGLSSALGLAVLDTLKTRVRARL